MVSQVEILTPHGTMKKSDLKFGENIASSCLSVQYIFHCRFKQSHQLLDQNTTDYITKCWTCLQVGILSLSFLFPPCPPTQQRNLSQVPSLVTPHVPGQISFHHFLCLQKPGTVHLFCHHFFYSNHPLREISRFPHYSKVLTPSHR